MKPTTPPNHSVAPVVMASLFVTFALIALASLLPQAREARLWGINHLAYYPLSVRVVAVAIVALSFVPAVARVVYAGLEGAARALARGGWAPRVTVVGLSLISIGVFYQFRAATYLLGDGQLIVQSFEAAYKGHDTVLMRSVGAILTSDAISPGMTLLYYWTLKAAVGVFGLTPGEGLVVLPCLLGGAFVFLVLQLVRAAPLPPVLRPWLLVMGFFTTSIQLFFGYIENYSAILVVLAWYAISAFRVMHRGASLWVPFVLLVVATFVHVQSVLFLPSLVFLIAWRVARGRRRIVLRWGAPALFILVLLVTLVARALDIPGDFYLPFFADDEGYGVFSPGHLLDMLNETLMLLPVAGFVLAAWYAGRSAAGQKTQGGTGPQRWLAEAVEWRFVALVIAPCVIYMTFFEPEIGMARDWDLFTMTTVGVVPLVLLVVNRLFGTPGAGVARISAPAMVMTVVLGLGWVGVNASSERTSERFESILAYDQTHAGYAYENLAEHYHSTGRLKKAIRAMEIGARVSGNPRLYTRLAFYYEENGDVAAAIQLLYDTLASHPDYDKTRAKLLDLLERANRWPELVDVARAGVKTNPNTALFHFALGEGLIRTGAIDEGLEAFRRCLALDPPQGAKDHIRSRLEEFGRR